MHIVALNHVYWPNSAATAQLLTELLESLRALGHRVTVIARDEPGESATERRGVRIVRVKDAGLGKGSLWRRAADYASFYAGCTRALLALDARPDVFMALTTPPLIALPAQAIGGLGGIPVVSVVQDLYPDVAVALGAIRAGSLLHRSFAAATRASLQRSQAVVTLSDAMRDRVLAYGAHPERVHTIANWALAELEGQRPTPGAGRQARLEYGLGDRFVVMYSGNMGAGHRFDTLLEAALRLRERGDIAFAFVGEGVRRGEIAAFVAAHALTNVRLFPLAPRESLAESLAAADVHVVTMRDDMVGLIVPSKLYGIYAAARPCLFIGPPEADVAQSIRAADAGHSFRHGEVDAVVRCIEAMAADPEAARAAGRRGRAHLEACHGRDAAVDAYVRVLEAAVRGAGDPPTARADHPSRRAR